MSGQVIIPDVGATGGDVRIVAWRVKPGDFVTAGTPLLTIETDKATEDLEACEAGYIKEILATAGSDVAIGTVVATLADSLDETQSHVASEKEAFMDGQMPASRNAGADSANVAKRRSVAPRLVASPAARRLARQLKMNLSMVKGSGASGAIHLKDVKRALADRRNNTAGAGVNTKVVIEAPNATCAASKQAADVMTAETQFTASNKQSTRVPLSRLRQAIADRVTKSKTEIPHFYVTQRVDMTEAEVACDWLAKAGNTTGGAKPTLNDLILRAAALALRATSELNALFRDGSLEVLKTIDLGIAVGTAKGVVIPVLRTVDQLNVFALANSTMQLRRRAADGVLSRGDLEGGAMSVSNLGMYGVEQFVAVIHPGQSSILACGEAKPSPVVVDGKIVIRTMMTVTLSMDHRVADGVAVAGFLREFKLLLETPQLLIAGQPGNE